MKDTVIVVGKTEVDGWENLWVTPKDGGDRVKIAKKREKLHPLFEQGKAVLLHWEVYMDKPYVANAELVTGNLSSATTPIEPAPHPDEPKPEELHKPSGVEVGRAINDICTLYTTDKLHILFGKENAEAILKWWRGHLAGTLRLPVDGAKLPMWDKKSE